MRRNNEVGGYAGLLVLVLALLVFSGWYVARGIWVDENVAVRTMEAQGYKNIQVTERAWLGLGLRGCDSKDAVRFTVKATGSTGNNTEVYVCAGVLKGGTIRVK